MRNKRIKTIFIAVIMLFIIAGQVIAAESSFTVKINSSSTKVKKGDEITVTLLLDSLSKADKEGTNAIQGSVNYDKNVLEYLNYEMKNNWNMGALNKENLSFAITNGEYISTSGEVISFKFKVKQDTNAKDFTINFENVKAAFGTSEDITNTVTVTTENKSAKIQIEEEKQEEPKNENTIPEQQNKVSNTSNNDNKVSNKTENKVDNKSKNEVANKTTNTSIKSDNNANNTNKSTIATNVSANTADKTVANKTIPKTGISNIVLFAIAILGGIAIVIYLKYNKYKEIK